MINVKFEEEINDIVTENLYQWDTYQTLKISGINFGSVTPRVHFANKKSTEALVVQGVLQSDGSLEVSIPNSLLTEKYDILGYIYTNTGLTSKTIKSITIPIIARLKPSEYVQISDEDIAQIEAIELEAKAIIDGLTASEYDSTETYKRPNIVYYNLCSYMCKSNVEITGVLPTDTSKWQQITKGSVITGVSVDTNGNLIFTDSTGAVFTIDFSVVDTEVFDDDDVPSLQMTLDNVNNCKKLDIVECEVDEVTGLYSPNYAGLFLINLKTTDNVYYTCMMSITSLIKKAKSPVILGTSYVDYYQNQDTGRYYFGVSGGTNLKIESIKRILRY